MRRRTLRFLDGVHGLFLTEDAPEPENEKKKKRTVNAVPEMGFLTSGNGTSTGNGRPISSNGKLGVWVLTGQLILEYIAREKSTVFLC